MTSKEFIDSGILEQYVLGNASAAEIEQIQLMVAADPVIQVEINAISQTLEKFAMENAVKPDPILKPFLMAVIDYTERLTNGEPVSDPPMLQSNSKPEDYAPWLNRADMVSYGNDDICAKIINYTPQVVTAIVWIKTYAPHEVHDNEFERFLVVEGTCDIIVEEEINHLVPGDYFSIPLHKTHLVKVTSAIPCKVILQRVAA